MQKWTPLTEPIYIKKSITDKHHELSNLKQEFDFCVLGDNIMCFSFWVTVVGRVKECNFCGK
jgi:hypothetical protein